MFKKKLYSFIGAFMILGLVGCGGNTSESPVKVDTKGKCDVFECIKIINTNDTYNQVVSKIGFEGELLDDNYYSWDLSDDTGISVMFHESGNDTIRISYSSSLVTKRANFSKWDEIKEKVGSDEGLTYDELVKLVGGIDGILNEKSNGSLTYKWLDSNGGYISAIFDSKTLKCTWISGWF